MKTIAVVGPGAIGGIVAAWLTQNSELSVTVCARSGLDDLRVETPDGAITAKPLVLTDPAAASVVDWVLVATKTYDVASTGVWLERLVGPETRVAVLQNGVEHVERFAGMMAAERIVPAVVDIPAARTAPGRMVQRRYGTIIVLEGRNGAEFMALFAGSRIGVSTDADLRSRAWAKLCLNCAGAVSTLTQRATGPVWSEEMETVVRALVSECAAVARAEGAVIADSVVEAVVDGARAAGEGGSNSMQADRLAGRPMEIDARNGVIVRLGRKHGIATPMNGLFVTLLQASGSPWVG